MSDGFPEFTDDEIELLRRLSGTQARSRPPVPRAVSLLEAVRSPTVLIGLDTRHLARRTVDRAAHALTRLMTREVALLRAKGKLGTFATEDCRALGPALMKIASARAALRAEAARRRELESLQLATCLDKKQLKTGAYQSHAERFMGSVAQLMAGYFPWLDCVLDIEENRVRADGTRGLIRDRFDSQMYDYMLVPRMSEPGMYLEEMYSYSFRVVGSLGDLNPLRDGDSTIIRVGKLQGHNLIVAPGGTSSRRRLHDLLQDAGVDIDDGSVTLIEERNPSSMRIRAEIGQGLAIISDEYSAIGGSARDFPRLGVHREGQPAEAHEVTMGLLRQPWTTAPRHRAFDFVVRELAAREKQRPRAAAQD